MRRIAAVLLAAVVLAAPTAADAGAAKQYEGAVAHVPDSRVAFSVVKHDGARKVRSIVAERVPLDCGNGHATAADVTGTKGSAAIVEGRFTFKADDGVRSFRIGGAVHRRRAAGGLRIAGRFELDGKTRDCDSGKLAWSAVRG
jgi:hypothetical protein